MNMKKSILVLLIGVLLGLAGGFAAGIFVYPYLFLDDIIASEPLHDAATRNVLPTGRFIHANPADPIHHGTGGVTAYRDLVRMEPDFVVGPGPKYHVYLVPDKVVTPDTDIPKTAFVDLGRLRAFRGSQNYSVPPGVDLTKFGSVVIWCEQFGVLISPASLQFATGTR
jgi:hypothetical protein